MSAAALRRLQALALTAVLLIGGSGTSALDLALYHVARGADPAPHRVAGTETPRPHADTCALLDWSARGHFAPALSPVPPQPFAPTPDRAPPFRPAAPRAADLSAVPSPRAPPVPLA